MLLDELLPEFHARASYGTQVVASPERVYAGVWTSAPGTAKAAWNFAVHPGTGGRSVLTTETRVLCADPATRRRFRTYWAVVGPFSGLIRREMLAAIRDTAEAASHTRAA